MIVHEFTCLDCNALFEESSSVKNTSCLYCGSTNVKKTDEICFKAKSESTHGCDDCSSCSGCS